MAKPITTQGNVVIPSPDDDSDEIQTINDMTTKSAFVPLTTKGEPIEQTQGKGRKQCPGCNLFISARSEICPNPECKHEFATGDSKPSGKSVHKCPHCSEVIHHRAKKCDSCGKEFTLEEHIVETVTGDASPKAPRKKSEATAEPVKIDKAAFIKVLAGKGFKFVRLVNEITGEVVKEESDPKIAKLNLVFQSIPKNAGEENPIFVTQTSPQIQVSMSLDKFLEVAGIKP